LTATWQREQNMDDRISDPRAGAYTEITVRTLDDLERERRDRQWLGF
jgi:hypothetical protein